jgi:hypothetical protein
LLETMCEVVLFLSPVVCCWLLIVVVPGTGKSVAPPENSVVEFSVIPVDFSSYQNNSPC